jgi:hypothetical protein
MDNCKRKIIHNYTQKGIDIRNMTLNNNDEYLNSDL